MTRGTVEESGEFRSRPAGVVDGEGNILHFGTLPQYVPGLVCELLDRVKNSDITMLIKSCVFHYESELIHPFADGNGRMGRLWHTLLLSRWNPVFAWLTVESLIHDRQKEYYEAINLSNAAGESTVFMLSVIKEALREAVSVQPGGTETRRDKREARGEAVRDFLKNHGLIVNAEVRRLFNVSPATANRILAGPVKDGTLKKTGEGSRRGYVKSQNDNG